jgi:hypothetical protein
MTMAQWEKADFEQVSVNAECSAYTNTNMDDVMTDWNEFETETTSSEEESSEEESF